MRAEIDWTIPATPPGWRGSLERFMGPGKARAELRAELAGSLVCMALLAWHLFAAPIEAVTRLPEPRSARKLCL